MHNQNTPIHAQRTQKIHTMMDMGHVQCKKAHSKQVHLHAHEHWDMQSTATQQLQRVSSPTGRLYNDVQPN